MCLERRYLGVRCPHAATQSHVLRSAQCVISSSADSVLTLPEGDIQDTQSDMIL
jgi:hypothetical protein